MHDVLDILREYTVTVAAILGAAAIISKTLHIGWKRFKIFTDTIEAVAAEFMPNGGSTMRDAVNRIERRIDDIQLFVDELKRERGTP